MYVHILFIGVVESVNFVKSLCFLGTNTINELATEMGAAILLLQVHYTSSVGGSAVFFCYIFRAF